MKLIALSAAALAVTANAQPQTFFDETGTIGDPSAFQEAATDLGIELTVETFASSSFVSFVETVDFEGFTANGDPDVFSDGPFDGFGALSIGDAPGLGISSDEIALTVTGVSTPANPDPNFVTLTFDEPVNAVAFDFLSRNISPTPEPTITATLDTGGQFIVVDAPSLATNFFWGIVSDTGFNSLTIVNSLASDLYALDTVFFGTIPDPADFNDDGVVDVFDLIDFLVVFAAGGSAADVDFSGDVDVFDLITFLVIFSGSTN